MQIVYPSVEFVNFVSYEDLLHKITYGARKCYKSYKQENDTLEKNENFVRNIIKRGHESVLEHGVITLDIKTDRGVLAEFTRHRTGIAYSVESTRYCNYSDSGIEFITPLTMYPKGCSEDIVNKHFESYEKAEKDYCELIKLGSTPQEARQVLPMSLSTNMVVTANVREWRHILKLRTSTAAHPNCQHLFTLIQKLFIKHYPVFFEDIPQNEIYWNSLA